MASTDAEAGNAAEVVPSDGVQAAVLIGFAVVSLLAFAQDGRVAQGTWIGLAGLGLVAFGTWSSLGWRLEWTPMVLLAIHLAWLGFAFAARDTCGVGHAPTDLYWDWVSYAYHTRDLVPAALTAVAAGILPWRVQAGGWGVIVGLILLAMGGLPALGDCTIAYGD